MGPARAAARMSREMLSNPLNPAASWYSSRATAAACDMFIDATRRYSKPEWDLKPLKIDDKLVNVTPETVLCHPFCNLINFKRTGAPMKGRNDPKVLIIAPMSGHYATLLRGTVQKMMVDHDVYITDWIDARNVPKPLSWFENNVLVTVPFPNTGFLRRVYPGFLQLSGFMSMNMDRHVDAHARQFRHLIKGDGESSGAHRKFYDEYLAVMDLTAEFYIQTIDRVFQKRLLAEGQYIYRDDHLIDPSQIKDIAFFTIEGEKDDITGLQQTEAAHDLLSKLPKSKKKHFVCPSVGHYGIFNGSRWREKIQPKVQDFIAKHRAKTG